VLELLQRPLLDEDDPFVVGALHKHNHCSHTYQCASGLLELKCSMSRPPLLSGSE
jgi:hypothetical protein